VAFPDAWWQAVEVLIAIASFGSDDEDYTAAIAAWRKTRIGRKADIRAKEFDNAARGAKAALAGKREPLADILARARWYVGRGILPTFARPSAYVYTKDELEIIRIARAKGLEPVFLGFDTTGIDLVPGPATKPNPWDKYRRM